MVITQILSDTNHLLCPVVTAALVLQRTVERASVKTRQRNETITEFCVNPLSLIQTGSALVVLLFSAENRLNVPVGFHAHAQKQVIFVLGSVAKKKQKKKRNSDRLNSSVNRNMSQITTPVQAEHLETVV